MLLIIIEFSENVIQMREKCRRVDCSAEESLIINQKTNSTMHHSAEKNECLIMNQ
jgi:hypothetical protein